MIGVSLANTVPDWKEISENWMVLAGRSIAKDEAKFGEICEMAGVLRGKGTRRRKDTKKG